MAQSMSRACSHGFPSTQSTSWRPDHWFLSSCGAFPEPLLTPWPPPSHSSPPRPALLCSCHTGLLTGPGPPSRPTNGLGLTIISAWKALLRHDLDLTHSIQGGLCSTGCLLEAPPWPPCLEGTRHPLSQSPVPAVFLSVASTTVCHAKATALPSVLLPPREGRSLTSRDCPVLLRPEHPEHSPAPPEALDPLEALGTNGPLKAPCPLCLAPLSPSSKPAAELSLGLGTFYGLGVQYISHQHRGH